MFSLKIAKNKFPTRTAIINLLFFAMKIGVRTIRFLGNKTRSFTPQPNTGKYIESLITTKYKPKTVEAKLYT